MFSRRINLIRKVQCVLQDEKDENEEKEEKNESRRAESLRMS